MRMSKYYGVILMLALAACQSTPPQPGMKLGKPYVVDGEIYYPEYEPSYDKIGEASWYGPGFHGKYTASGEIFNQNDLTAAHPTLPMPSLVRVTNLSNGKSLIVRINDRGPFKSHRIIDLSKEAARQLGIRSIARVRVQFLRQETTEYLASLQHGGSRRVDMARYNDNAEPEEPQQDAAPPSQIVENTESYSHAGQTVNDAAPIVTVSAGELTPYKTATGGLMREAWADDGAAAPSSENPPGFAPQSVKVAPLRAISASAYIIQAGSFSAEENARRLASRLSGMALLAVDNVDIGEKSWWRVRVGPFKNQQEADAVLARVRAAGAPDARIVHL